MDDTTVQALDATDSAKAAVGGSDEAFAKLLGLSTETTPAPAPAPEVNTSPKDPFTQQNLPDAEEAEAPPASEAPAPEAAEAPPEEKPEEKPDAAKPPLTKFVMYDEQGELEVPQDVKFSFKANGKEMKDVPLEKVVQMAQRGYYNEEREQQVLAAKEFVQQAEQEKGQLTQMVQQYEQAYAQLFTDPDFYERARERFMASQTPEARAQRLEVENAQLKQARERESATQAIQQFTEQQIVPAVNQLMAQYPEVAQQEVLDMFSRLVRPLQQQGVVPPQRLAEVKHLIDNDLTYFVSGLADERRAKTEAKSVEVKQAQQQATQAKRQLARAVTPPANAAPITNDQTKKPVKFKSAKEWLDSTFALPSDED